MEDYDAWLRSLTGTVRARALDRAGLVLTDARLIAEGSEPGTWIDARAGADGEIVLRDVPARPNTTLWIEAPGHARRRLEQICVFPDRETRLAELILGPGRMLRARIVDRAGRAIVGARLEVDQWQHLAVGSLRRDGPMHRCDADAAGRLQVATLGRSRCELHLRAPAHRTRRLEVPIDERSIVDLGDVQLSDEPKRVRGRLFDAHEQPVRERTIRSAEGAAVRTDEHGRFEMDVWQDDLPQLTVEGSERVWRAGEPAAGLDIELKLEPRRWLAATVRDRRTGRPLDPTDVSLCEVLRDVDGKPVGLG